MKKKWILIKGALFGDFKLFYFLTWADKRHKLSWDDEIPRNLPALQSCLINTHLTSKTPQKTPRKGKNTLKVFLVTKHDRRINSSSKKNDLTPRKNCLPLLTESPATRWQTMQISSRDNSWRQLIPILPLTFLFAFVPKSTPTLLSFFHFLICSDMFCLSFDCGYSTRSPWWKSSSVRDPLEPSYELFLESEGAVFSNRSC